jgi:hypothetical protein
MATAAVAPIAAPAAASRPPMANVNIRATNHCESAIARSPCGLACLSAPRSPPMPRLCRRTARCRVSVHEVDAISPSRGPRESETAYASLPNAPPMYLRVQQLTPPVIYESQQDRTRVIAAYADVAVGQRFSSRLLHPCRSGHWHSALRPCGLARGRPRHELLAATCLRLPVHVDATVCEQHFATTSASFKNCRSRMTSFLVMIFRVKPSREPSARAASCGKRQGFVTSFGRRGCHRR